MSEMLWAQTPLLRPISAVDDHLRIAAGLVSTRMVDNDGSTALAQFRRRST